MLVGFRAGVAESEQQAVLDLYGYRPARRLRSLRRRASVLDRLYRVTLPAGIPLETALEAARRHPLVELAQPNYVYHARSSPNDQYFYLQWAHDNNGDNSPYDEYGLNGPDPWVAGADIGASEAFDWIESIGLEMEPVVVGIVDTGIDLEHPDLVASLWTNSGEIPGNGGDDDGNGYADDVHGWDFAYDDAVPADGDGHGTHVSGVVGATCNNAIGVCGIAPNASIMVLKFLDDSGSGTTSDAVEAILYGIDNGARILNNSWGGGGYDTALANAIDLARTAGILFVAAAGNDGSDNDLAPHYPSNFSYDNVLSVAASDPWRGLADFSNWGAATVHLAAPGDEIISTTPLALGAGVPETAYQIAMTTSYPGLAPWSGTSMATPAVSAAAAVLYGLGADLWLEWSSWGPMARTAAVRDRLLARTERWPAFGGASVTEGHLDLASLIDPDSTAPASVGADLYANTSGSSFVTLRCVASGDDGSVGRANYYDLRFQPGATIDFAAATPVAGVWTPGPPGSVDAFLVRDLEPDTLYTFGLEVVDNAGNASAPSDPLTVQTAAEAALWEDDMESGTNGWTSTTWAQTTESAHSPTQSWTDSPGGLYPNRADLTLTSPEIVSGGLPITVRYWQRYDIETNYDYGFVETRSYVAGAWSTWTTQATVTGVNLTWHPAATTTGTAAERIQVRFRLVTDRLIQRDGWHIDDVRIVPTTTPGVVLFEDSFDTAAAWSLVGTWGLESGTLSDSPGDLYPINNRASATLTAPLDLSSAGEVLVSYDLVSMAYESGYDFLFFDYSLDGSNWRIARRYTGSTTGTQIVDLSFLAGMPSVYLRFRSLSDYGISQAGAHIDNFLVEVRRAADLCPVDPGKTEPEVCGCGVADTDADGDLTLDCLDACAADPDKTDPGVCGCGVADTDADGDLTLDCLDGCAADPDKTDPGFCGCGVAESDPACGLLFGDGFESGDTSSWSATTG